ncbi:MAG: hypothetical protein HY721_18800 [Planctomycetes bacterium]|nr:hypothetical protein [Planctomycetota bacterium]
MVDRGNASRTGSLLDPSAQAAPAPPPAIIERAKEIHLAALTGLSDWEAARRALDDGELPAHAVKEIADAERLAAAQPDQITEANVQLAPFGADVAGPSRAPAAAKDLGEIGSIERIRLSFVIEIEEQSWDRNIWVGLRPWQEGGTADYKRFYGVEICHAGGAGNARRRLLIRWGGRDNSLADEPPRIFDAPSFREATGKPGRPRYRVTLEGPARGVIHARVEELEPQAHGARGADPIPDAQHAGLRADAPAETQGPLISPPPGRYQLGVFDPYGGVIPQEKGGRGPTRARIWELRLQRIP